jgi:hypothetical protein
VAAPCVPRPRHWQPHRRPKPQSPARRRLPRRRRRRRAARAAAGRPGRHLAAGRAVRHHDVCSPGLAGRSGACSAAAVTVTVLRVHRLGGLPGCKHHDATTGRPDGPGSPLPGRCHPARGLLRLMPGPPPPPMLPLLPPRLPGPPAGPPGPPLAAAPTAMPVAACHSGLRGPDGPRAAANAGTGSDVVRPGTAVGPRLAPSGGQVAPQPERCYRRVVMMPGAWPWKLTRLELEGPGTCARATSGSDAAAHLGDRSVTNITRCPCLPCAFHQLLAL